MTVRKAKCSNCRALDWFIANDFPCVLPKELAVILTGMAVKNSHLIIVLVSHCFSSFTVPNCR